MSPSKVNVVILHWIWKRKTMQNNNKQHCNEGLLCSIKKLNERTARLGMIDLKDYSCVNYFITVKIFNIVSKGWINMCSIILIYLLFIVPWIHMNLKNNPLLHLSFYLWDFKCHIVLFLCKSYEAVKIS